MSTGQTISPDKIKAIRLTMGFRTPGDFAEAINARLKADPGWDGPTDLSHRTIDRLEKGSYEPRVSTLRAISRAFGIRWEAFLIDND